MSTLTAKDFQNPLLRALGDLTGCTAQVAVLADSTYTPVMTIMGITDIMALGTEDASGQPMVQRQIQWACKNLRKTGHMDREGRGLWVLTDKGAQAAQALCQGVATPAPAPVVVPAVAVAPAAPQAPVPPPHLRDPYILGLLLEQTPCLGHYSAHGGAECVTCPVTTVCQNKQYSNYSQAALRLAHEDAQVTKAAIQPKAAPVVAPATTPKAPPASTLDLSSAQKITAFEETICVECGKPITKGSACYWVEDTAKNESRMLHLECLKGAK